MTETAVEVEDLGPFHPVTDFEISRARTFVFGQTHYWVNEHLLRALANKVRARYEQVELWLAVRLTLNDFRIFNDARKGDHTRDRYKSAIGKIFSERSKKRRKATKLPKFQKLPKLKAPKLSKLKKRSKILVTLNEKTGQYRLVL